TDPDSNVCRRHGPRNCRSQYTGRGYDRQTAPTALVLRAAWPVNRVNAKIKQRRAITTGVERMSQWTSFNAFLQEALQAESDEQRQKLVDALLAERKQWPWIEGNRATFVLSRPDVETAALNLDTIQADPPFAMMTNLPGTTFWYVTQEFAPDDLLDYMLAINDPLTPLANEPDVI